MSKRCLGRTISTSFYTTDAPTNLPELVLNNTLIKVVKEYAQIDLTVRSNLS